MNGKSDWMQTNALTRPVNVSAFICVLRLLVLLSKQVIVVEEDWPCTSDQIAGEWPFTWDLAALRDVLGLRTTLLEVDSHGVLAVKEDCAVAGETRGHLALVRTRLTQGHHWGACITLNAARCGTGSRLRARCTAPQEPRWRP